MLLELHGAEIGSSRCLFVGFGAVTLHLLYLSLNLRLGLSFVHALTNKNVHEQDLLLARGDGSIVLYFLLACVTLNLQVLTVWKTTTNLPRVLLSEGTMHVLPRFLHLSVLGR